MTELSLLLCYAVCFVVLWGLSSLIARRLCGHEGQPSPLLDGTALVILAAAGYLAFWLYVVSPVLGGFSSGLFLIGGGIWALFRLRYRWKHVGDLFSRPVRVTFLFGLLYLSGISVFGGVETTPTWFVPEIGADPPSAVFWLQPRSIDSLIPVKFASAVVRQEHLLEDINFGVWRFSDRPPVQAGVLLLCWPLTKWFGVGVVHLAVGVLLQVQWVLGVFLVGWAFGWRRARTTFVVLALGTTGFVYFSSVYVWPKFLAAALWLAGSAVLVRVFRQNRAPTASETVVAASAWVSAFLSHGGIGFSLLPAGLLVLSYRPFRSWRFWLPAFSVALFFYLPWMGYQKFLDPPGDRCLKLMFAGSAEDPDQHWIRATIDGYKRMVWPKFLWRQQENFSLLFGDRHLDHNIAVCVQGIIEPKNVSPDSRQEFRKRYYAEESLLRHDVATLAALLRYDQVEQTFRALGLMNLAWPILLWAVLRSRWRFVRQKGLDVLLLHTGLTLLIWWLLIYRDGHLVIRNASYGMMLCLLMIAASVIFDAPKILRNAIFGSHLALSVVLWVALVPTDFAREYLHLQNSPCAAPLGGALLAVTSLVSLAVAGKFTNWWDDAVPSAPDFC